MSLIFEAAAILATLHRRAWCGSIETKDAAISGEGFQECLALRALHKVLAGVLGHLMCFVMSTFGTCHV